MSRYQFISEAIHADWPAYPAGHGTSLSLDMLCRFPQGTHFKKIDDIDKCLLLSAAEYEAPHATDKYSDKHHHVALWHDDIISMADIGWLGGVLADDDEDDEWIQLDAAGVIVTGTGWRALASHISPLNNLLSLRVEPILAAGFFDAAIREASVVIESELRRRTGVNSIGQALVDKYMRKAVGTAGIRGAFQRFLHSELRAFFRFVRNEFAHNIVDVNAGRCRALLRRASAILDMLDDADAGYSAFQDIVLKPE